MKVKQIEWSEVQEPNSECAYNHVIGVTPFGRFLLTWKGWKERFDACFDETPWGEFAGALGNSVEECQQEAQDMFDMRIKEAVEN